MKTQMKVLSGTEVVVRNERGLLSAEVDEALIGMSIEQGACYGFNKVGTRIWALLAEPIAINTICEQLLREYDVEEARCRTEVIELLSRLRHQNLLAIRTP